MASRLPPEKGSRPKDLDIDDGMPGGARALSLDNLTTMPKAFLVERVYRLDIAKMAELSRALRVPTGCG